jgi:hypothetical protein
MEFRGILAIVLMLLSPAVMADEQTTVQAEPGHKEERGDAPVTVSRDDQGRSFAPPVVRGNFQSIQVNIDGAGNNIVGDAANEPSMAIDPTDPNNIVIGWRQFDTIASNFRQAGYAYSHDGGATWTFPGVLQPGQFRSDPVLVADSLGTFFYYSLSTTTNAEMFISFDKGINWSGPIPAFGGDKTWMNADTTGGQGNDHVYTLWNSQFSCCGGGTDFTRTTDGGNNYDGPFAMPSKAKWGTVDVGPGGEVYVVGTRVTGTAFPQPHLIMKSSNAQNAAQNPTWEQTTGINLGGNTITGATPNPGGLAGQVWVAVDRSGGATDGNVYVLGSVDPGGADPLDLNFVRSTDDAASFSSPLRINRDGIGNYQWFGAMSVAPNGRIDVTWYDTRTDGNAQTSEVWYAYSDDAGLSFSEGLPVTPSFNSLVGHPNQNKIGDYTHMISDADGAALTYSATFNGEQDVYFVRLGDCNANGTHDGVDIDQATSEDCDFNGIPDECQDSVTCLTCNNDGTCDLGEDCNTCSGDCFTGPSGCGNGTCEPSLGEDCLSCPADCNGRQKGKPSNQYCCGDGAGTNPVDCGDSRCTGGGLTCSNSTVPPTCCGDGTCEGAENSTNCEVDCGPTGGGCGNGVCEPGENCNSCPGDCDGKDKGNPSRQFCCGDGIRQSAEGDGTVCDGNF